MRAGYIVLFAASVAMAAPPATKPTTRAAGAAKVNVQPATQRAAAGVDPQQAQQNAIRASMRADLTRLQFAGRYRLSDILSVSVREGLLSVSWQNPTQMTNRVRIEIEGSTATWAMMANEANLNLERFEDNPRRFSRMTLSARPEYLYLTSSGGVLAGEDQLLSVSYQQSRGTVRLVVNMRNVNSNLQIAAPTLPDLRQQDPKAVRKYLIPIMEAMLGENPLVPGAADVYSVWGAEIDSAAAERQLAAILPRLGSEMPWEREEATSQLLAMGRQGVVAALQLNRQDLSPEQLSRIDGMLMRHTRRAYATAAEARADAMFLIDCLEYPDVAVRKAALRDLSTLLGRPVKFDVSAEPAALAEAADALRVAVRRQLQNEGAAARPAP